MENKVKINLERETKEVELPSFAGSKVVVYASLLVGDLGDVDLASENSLKMSLEALPKIIKSWNLIGQDDKDLPITSDTLKKMPLKDISFLLQEVADFASAQKKN